ncbi:unnamed protein product [Blepharisma stoltei]|uniref:tRNA-uridine aminocarboxypropyltransferase 1 n=1 Tax=Blepharisma stoltei TaxID=1481888 RepID=A0AAU9IUL8_9CILI|nr:unnamed protein product [Blepharisma stoltei]
MEREAHDEHLLERLELASFEPLENATNRQKCPKCDRNRKYYCYDCCIGLTPDIPKVVLPLQVHILKCIKEARSKSSAVPIKVLAPDHSEVIGCLGEDRSVPEYPDTAVLVFPGENARSIPELSTEELQKIKTAVFIDSTWNQTNSMLKDRVLSSMPMIKLETHITTFWRYQSESKHSLATIEAVYYFLVDFHREMFKRGLWEQDYAGEYDNVLWYYAFHYNLVQKVHSKKSHHGKLATKKPDYLKKIDK